MTIAFVSGGTYTATGGTTGTFTLSAAVGEVVVLPAVATTTGAAITLSVSGGGLTWLQRGVPLLSAAGVFQTTNLFYAVVGSTVTSQTITVTASGTMSSTCGGYSRFTGVNNASPWDPNVSTPATATTTTAASPSVTVSTTDPNTAILALVGKGGALLSGAAITPSTIGSHLGVNAANAGGNISNCLMWYGLYTTQQSSLAVTETGSISNLTFMVNALTAGPAATSNSNFFFAA